MECDPTHTGFRGLPCEIIESIAKYLDPDDILSLRSSHPDLATKSFDVFKRTFFANVPIMLSSQSSMEVLRSISRHNELSKEVRTIRFSLDVLKEWKRYESMTMESLPDAPTGVVYTDPLATEIRKLRDIRRNEQHHYNEWIAKQDDFRCGIDLCYLMEIFRNFMAIGNIPAIIATTGEPEVRNPPFGLFGLDRSDTRPFKIIWKALIETRYPVKHLELGSRDHGVQYSTFRRCYPSSIYENLTTLKVIVQPIDNNPNNCGMAAMEMDSYHEVCFAKFLGSAKKIRQFKFGSDDLYLPHSDWWSGMWKLCLRAEDIGKEFLPNLETLDLEGMGLIPDQLMEFIEPQASHLRGVYLNNVRTDDMDYDVDDDNLAMRLLDALYAGGGGETNEVEFINSYNGTESPFPIPWDEHLRLNTPPWGEACVN